MVAAYCSLDNKRHLRHSRTDRVLLQKNTIRYVRELQIDVARLPIRTIIGTETKGSVSNGFLSLSAIGGQYCPMRNVDQARLTTHDKKKCAQDIVLL